MQKVGVIAKVRWDSPHTRNNSYTQNIEYITRGLDEHEKQEALEWNDILDKIAAVVFFIVVLLDAGKRDAEHAAHFGRQVIAAGNKHGILRLHLGAKGLVGNAVPDEQLVIFAQIRRQKIVRLANLGQVAAGNDGGALINDADHAVHSIPHLINQALEQTIRHKTTPLLSQKIAVTHSL